MEIENLEKEVTTLIAIWNLLDTSYVDKKVAKRIFKRNFESIYSRSLKIKEDLESLLNMNSPLIRESTIEEAKKDMDSIEYILHLIKDFIE